MAKRMLREFWENPGFTDAEQPLKTWYLEARNAAWKTPQDIKVHYRHAGFLKDNRVVFNIAGNKYRLIVKINYPLGIVYTRFIGTHKQYDAIDAETV